MNESQIEQLRPSVESETGMDFSGSRLIRLQDAVEKVVANHRDSADIDRLLANPHQRNVFLERITAELTIGESFFFRNEHHFHALREEVIPDIMRCNADRREIRIWSAGCAGGEEPYSLAILLNQLLGAQQSHWSTSILATDINTEFLSRARRAEYRAWSFRRTEIHQDTEYFTLRDGVHCLRPQMGDGVRFLYLNLVKDVYPSPLTGTVGLDLILFRNVAIYLQSEVVRAIVQRFCRCLRPGGWLLLGEAEVSQIRADGFDVRRFGQATFFQKLRHAASATLPTEMPKPVLPTFLDATAVCSLPEPTRSWGASSGEAKMPDVGNQRVSRPVALLPVPTVPPPKLDWENVEACLNHEDFTAAERLIGTVGDVQQRVSLKFRYVRRLLDLSRTDHARRMLDACLEEQPLMIDGYLLKAGLAEEHGDLRETEDACRRALYLDRNCVMAHFHLAVVQQQIGDVAGARRSLQLVQKLAESEDEDALVQHGDGVCYGRLWELAQSILDS